MSQTGCHGCTDSILRVLIRCPRLSTPAHTNPLMTSPCLVRSCQYSLCHCCQRQWFYRCSERNPIHCWRLQSYLIMHHCSSLSSCLLPQGAPQWNRGEWVMQDIYRCPCWGQQSHMIRLSYVLGCPCQSMVRQLTFYYDLLCYDLIFSVWKHWGL